MPPGHGDSEVGGCAGGGDEGASFGVQVKAELDLHLVRGLGHLADLRDDRLGGGLDTLYGVFKGLPGSFNHHAAAEVPCDWTLGTGRLVDLYEDRATVV
jgi:hypothetical protein